VSELEDAWEAAIADAHRRAQSEGRADIAAYLRLRASNDLSRKTGIDWLLETFARLAGDANRSGASLQMQKDDSHKFSSHHATMVGPRLTLTFGVRSLLIEAGWPRVPGDSFVRGGGLARGHIKHFGKQTFDQDLLLVRLNDKSLDWLVLEKTGQKTRFLEADARRHLDKLLSADYR